MADHLFAGAAPRSPAAPLTVFRAELLSHGAANWEELFEGCTALKAARLAAVCAGRADHQPRREHDPA